MNRTVLVAAALALGAASDTPAQQMADIPSATEQCNSDLDLEAHTEVETTPSSDFTPLEGGAVVRHEPTGLEWRRCPEGMSWTDGVGCSGSATTMRWQEALQHADGEGDWRLPDINELRSIVERCRTNPAINKEVFPNTRSSSFWSASPATRSSGDAWVVNFGAGSDGGLHKWNSRRVRLVRGGSDQGGGYSHENFTVTNGSYSEEENNDQACKSEFGSNYRLADWDDVVSYYQSGASMNDFFINLGIPAPGTEGRRSLMVSRSGEELYSSTRHYFISRHDHNKPGHYLAHDNIDNYLISLGSWNGSNPALCYEEDGPESVENTSYCGLNGEWNDQESWCEGEIGHNERVTLAEASSSTGCGGYFKTRGYYFDGKLLALFISNGHCRASSQSFPVSPPESLDAHCSRYGGTGSYRWRYHSNPSWHGNTVGVQCEVMIEE